MAIEWRNDREYLDNVKLPGGETLYWVRDLEARDKIEALVSATQFLGVTTTPITEGATTNPITITGEEEPITATRGNIVIYKGTTPPQEFIFDGTQWQLLGGQAIDGLGDLAYQDTASASYTPSGTVEGNVSTVVTGVSRGSLETWIDLSTGSFDGAEQLTLDGSITTDTTEIPIDWTATLEGYQSTSVITGFNTYGASGVTDFDRGTLPSLSTSTTLSAEVSGTTLVFNLSNLGFDAGTLPSISLESITTLSDIFDGTISVPSEINIYSTGSNATVLTGVSLEIDDIYYSVGLSGQPGVGESDLSLTFSGTTDTITVS